jgi:hypothetical protein
MCVRPAMTYLISFCVTPNLAMCLKKKAINMDVDPDSTFFTITNVKFRQPYTHKMGNIMVLKVSAALTYPIIFSSHLSWLRSDPPRAGSGSRIIRNRKISLRIQKHFLKAVRYLMNGSNLAIVWLT